LQLRRPALLLKRVDPVVMRYRRLLPLAFIFLVAPLLGAPLALHDGEALDFRVSWGIFFHAGEIAIRARAETDDGRPCTVIASTTSTRGVLRGLFRFEAHAESVIENATGAMLIHTESSAGGRKKTSNSLVFDYKSGTAQFTDLVNPSNNETVPLPAGDPPLDLITSLIQTRAWSLQPGESRDLNVTFENEIYQLTIHALRYEDLTTPLGKFRTIVYEPRMEKTPPKGMFKRGSQVHVWIAQDDPRRLPVKFEVEFSFGTGVATLVRYPPPGTAPAAADTPAGSADAP
jgi:hypothetical protein